MMRRLFLTLAALFCLIGTANGQYFEKAKPGLAEQARAQFTRQLLAQAPANLPAPILNLSANFLGAARLDGTNDYQLRGANLTGAADTKVVLGSHWVLIAGADGANLFIHQNASLGGATLQLSRNASNGITLLARNVAGSNILISVSTETITAATGWVNILYSFDLADTGKRFVYLNDVAATMSWSTYVDDLMNFGLATDWAIGAQANAANKFNGCMTENYLRLGGTFFDISNTANRRKFITAAKKPVPLGATGQLPTGATPIEYYTVLAAASAATLANNRGTGGDMTITGAYDACASSPG